MAGSKGRAKLKNMLRTKISEKLKSIEPQTKFLYSYKNSDTHWRKQGRPLSRQPIGACLEGTGEQPTKAANKNLRIHSLYGINNI